ncbi:ABC transporter ATP-binding protein [Siminovitchia fordii]|uniref:Peptide ABC transporter ATP-binding protein n=1 Tax=Siminovitchia fordii TaxID=254759 RepID=A0ABQ4K8Q2_9BACI|nr:ABC transporter ATP-binding protein [Siminovitchia fordii]GIN21528.1 peptide ABC transporter ATP-binding protein [Siminovitchia fordii]
MTETLLKLDKLKTHFHTERGMVTAVDGISFEVSKGEIVGLVGESGCGKSVTLQSILRLLDERSVEYEGEVNYKGKNLLNCDKREMQHIRGNEISMIFQDPLSSLNPVQTIGRQISEPIMIHQKVSKKAAKKEAINLLRLVGIPNPEARINEYPHQLSGGMRQRAMIAVALACKPSLLLADEPTTALDVTIQSQILKLIKDLNEELDMGVIFITHDLGVVAELCSRVIVMYLGEIVEEASIQELFTRPLHPYTQGLIKSIPKIDGNRSEELYVIKGTVPSLSQVPKGCRFANRCLYANNKCFDAPPPTYTETNSQKVKCWHYKEIQEKKEAVHREIANTK